MLTYTVYSEAGGPGKTTLSANLAKAHADHGHDTLVIDLDQQDGSLSFLLGVEDDRDNDSVDTLVHHLIDRPKGDFEDLIRTSEGVDIIPSHNMLQELGGLLEKAASIAEQTGDSFNRFSRLRHVLAKNDVPDEYDVVIVDPPGTAGPHLYNGLDATRSLVIPVELTGKGKQSIQGLKSLAAGLGDRLGIDVGVLAMVPNDYKGTNDQDAYLEEIDEMEYANPVLIRHAGSLLEGCWRQHCTAFTYVDEHRDRERDNELAVLDRFDSLARHLEQEAGL